MSFPSIGQVRWIIKPIWFLALLECCRDWVASLPIASERHPLAAGGSTGMNDLVDLVSPTCHENIQCTEDIRLSNLTWMIVRIWYSNQGTQMKYIFY